MDGGLSQYFNILIYMIISGILIFLWVLWDMWKGRK
jgi:hypothetical protein